MEADFSMDGSDLLASKLTSESCHCDLKGFYILYSHICISLTPSLTLHLYLSGTNGEKVKYCLVESMLCTDKSDCLRNNN